MKTKNIIIAIVVLFVLGAVTFGGRYLFKSLNQENSLIAEESNTVKENNSAENNEDELDSETENDNITKPAVNDEEDNKEDALEKEETYEDKEGVVFADSPELSIEEGLVAYYPFNEDIKDYSGKKIDATNHNAYFVDGKYGKALKFNGKNSFVQVPTDINPASMPQMTMAVWVKAEKGSVVVRYIIGNNGKDEYDRTIGTDFRGGGKGWSCFAGDDGMVLGYSPVVAEKWTFVAAVYDENAGTVKLFVDGTIYEKDGKMIDKGNDFILIGARGLTTTNQTHHFNGVIDEVKIYDYALPAKELNSLYKTGIAKPVLE